MDAFTRADWCQGSAAAEAELSDTPKFDQQPSQLAPKPAPASDLGAQDHSAERRQRCTAWQSHEESLAYATEALQPEDKGQDVTSRHVNDGAAPCTRNVELSNYDSTSIR